MMTLSPLAMSPSGRVTVELADRALMPEPRLQSTRATPDELTVTLLTRCARVVAAKGFMIVEPTEKMSLISAVVTTSSCEIRSATTEATCPVRFWAMKPWQNSDRPK